MSGFLNPIGWEFLDDNGDPLSLGLLYAYEAGTSTPLPIYTTQALSVALANPATINSGRLISFMPDGVAYKFILKDALGNTLATFDDISVPTVPAPPSVTDLTGVIKMFGGSSAPTGYFLCDGSAVSRSTYSALFAILGTAFGVGNGSTTFNLPDMRQRFPIGVAASGTGATLGGTGGSIDHLHTGPSHTHDAGTFAVPSGGAHTHTTGAPSATIAAQSGAGTTMPTVGHTHDIASSGAHTHSVTGNTGSSGTGNTGAANPPFQAVNFIVKT